MPRCCHLTRREVLQWGALVAASPLLSSLADPERAYGMTRAVASGPTVAMELELVTLTETSVVLTWYTGDPTRIDPVGRLAPKPADTELLLGTSSTNLRTIVHEAGPTPYHHVEVADLEPGQTYFFLAKSAGLPALPTPSSFGNPLGTSVLQGLPQGPFTFTTPQPPPGTHLFSIALCNDLHLGESVAGLITSKAGIEIPPGITQVPGEPPYSEVMASALGPEAHARGADLLLAAGDISSEAAQADVAHAKGYLDAFGTYEHDYHVVRGNHDRPHTGHAVETCRPDPRAAGYHDCFGESFFPSGPTWFRREAFGLRILGLDTYDKIGSGGDNGVLSTEQWGFVRDELAQDRDQPTIVLGHHPVSLESNLTTLEPLIFDLNPTQAQQLEELYARTPGVFLHHAGHTHRNRRTTGLTASGVTFQEVAAVKEYPGGFHLLRVFTGGYALNFYKLRGALQQEWSERSRQEYGGLAPFYVFGNAADRNSVVVRDLSGLESAVRAATTPTSAPPSATTTSAPPTARGRTRLPATGGRDRRDALVGGVALAAAAAAERWLARNPHRDAAG
jgi:Icc protein